MEKKDPRTSASPRPTMAQRPTAQAGAARPQQNGAARRTAPAGQASSTNTEKKPTYSVNKGRVNELTGKITTYLIVLVCIAALVVYLAKGTKKDTAAVSHGVEISEVMTGNKGTVADEYGEFPDWIELHNTTDGRIDIGGFGLTDSPYGAVKWTVPVGTSIDPDGYLIIYCAGDSTKGRLYAPFKLSAGETVTLTTDGGATADSVTAGVTDPGMSYARDYTGAFSAMEPTPGYPNTAEGRQAYLATQTAYAAENPGVYLNEFMASNASTIMGPDGTYCDWIELYNTTGETVDLSGYGLSDESTRPLKSVLPEGTTIPPYGVLLVYCTGADGGTPEKPEVGFGLRAYGETILFSNPQGKILDSVDYTRLETDISVMRSPDGTGTWAETTEPTPGYPNTQTGLANYMSSQSSQYGTGSIRLSEVLAANYSTLRQADLTYPDWIEIYNASSEPLNLAGYALSKNAKNPAKWVFPNMTIGAGQYIVVLATGTSVTDTQKKNLSVNFSLSGEGDSVFLFNPEGKLVDKLRFGRAHADVSYGRTGDTLMYYSTPTPGAANGTGSLMYTSMPEFTLASGVYTEAQTVRILVPEGATVYYTLDGSTPTKDSYAYSGALELKNNTILRARSFRDGFEPSDVATASYFINLTGTETLDSHKTNFAIVSLVTDNAAFFDADTGIYVAGSTYAAKTGEDALATTLVNGTNEKQWKLANFNAQHESHPDPLGLQWERSCHVEIIDENGVYEYGDDAMIRIFGAFSRFEAQKGMAVVTRSGYGTSALNDKIFPNREFTSYQSIVLRPSAMDWKMSKIRDILFQGLLDESSSILPTQAYRRAIVYINGRYWGLYNIREKVNKDFIAQHYNVSPDSVEILVGNGTSQASQISGENAYLEYADMIEWVKNHDLSESANYEYIKTLIDVENYAEYCAMEIYVGNTDTGNIKCWRSAQYDNKWRWIPYDFDWAFNRNDEKSVDSTSGYRRNFFAKYFHEKGHGVGKGFSTVLSRGLLRNKEWRALFLKKCALMYTDYLSSEKLLARISELEEEMANEMNWDTERWDGFSYKTWQTSITNLKDSATNAPQYFLKYCQEYFSLSDDNMITLFGAVSSVK